MRLLRTFLIIAFLSLFFLSPTRHNQNHIYANPLAQNTDPENTQNTTTSQTQLQLPPLLFSVCVIPQGTSSDNIKVGECDKVGTVNDTFIIYIDGLNLPNDATQIGTLWYRVNNQTLLKAQDIQITRTNVTLNISDFIKSLKITKNTSISLYVTDLKSDISDVYTSNIDTVAVNPEENAGVCVKSNQDCYDISDCNTGGGSACNGYVCVGANIPGKNTTAPESLTMPGKCTADPEYVRQLEQACKTAISGNELSNLPQCDTNPDLKRYYPSTCTDKKITCVEENQKLCIYGNATRNNVYCTEIAPPPAPCTTYALIDSKSNPTLPTKVEVKTQADLNRIDLKKYKCDNLATALGVFSFTPTDFVKTIFAALLSFAGGIAVLLIIYSGYRMVTSQGNPEAIQGARETITSAVVGLLFTIFSLVVLEVIGVDILKIPGFKGTDGPSQQQIDDQYKAQGYCIFSGDNTGKGTSIRIPRGQSKCRDDNTVLTCDASGNQHEDIKCSSNTQCRNDNSIVGYSCVPFGGTGEVDGAICNITDPNLPGANAGSYPKKCQNPNSLCLPDDTNPGINRCTDLSSKGIQR